jgi:polyhydroxyalkanoate synthesis regulator phasin
MEGDEPMTDEQRRRPGIGEGIRSGIGMLTAVKEAIEETIREASERGDLKPERARQFLNDAMERAQEAVGDVRERLDFVPRKEFDELRAEVGELRRQLDSLRGGSGGAARRALPPVSGFEGTTAAELPSSERTGGEGPTEARMA